MQSIKNLLVKTGGNTHQQNGSQEQLVSKSIDLCKIFNDYPVDARERLYLLKFWLRMAEMYRQMWTNAQGELPSDLWSKVLLQVGEQVAFSTLMHFLKVGQVYPPTLPEFYAATYRYRLSSQRFFIALPKQVTNKTIVSAHIKQIRTVLNNKNWGYNP